MEHPIGPLGGEAADDQPGGPRHVAGDVLRSRLNGSNAEVELCDESGRTVGRFVPEDSYKQLLYAWAVVTALWNTYVEGSESS